jgi:hypothetical protein
MRSMSRLASTALVGAALMVGCSSPSNNNKDGAMTSGPQPTDKLVDLSPADLHTVCLQESADGTGAVSCAGTGAVSTAIGVCTSIQPDCSATVATSQTCTAKLTADACNYAAYTADLNTPECLVMLACTASLCTNAMFLCSTNDMLTTALTTCKTLTKGLTTDCAACIAGAFTGGGTCPDFTMSPYDQCAAACAHTAGGG